MYFNTELKPGYLTHSFFYARFSVFLSRSGATGCSVIARFGTRRRLARITESGKFVKLDK